jgi:hypothetical protein
MSLEKQIMSKQMQIPINEFDYFTSNGNYAGVKFRYRLKEDDTDNNTSQWSEPVELIFKNSENVNISLSETNGYDFPTFIERTNPVTGLVWQSTNNRMMPSKIDQIISQTSLTGTPGNIVPKNDLYRLSFITPESFNVGKFDIFQSWRGIAYVHPTANVSAPSGSGPFTGTITLTGTNATLRGQTLKSYHDWYETFVGEDLPLYATEGTSTPGNTFVVTDYSGTSTFSIRSAATWTASGNFRNISRANAFTTPEYVATIPTNTYEFSRKMTSNKVSATLVGTDRNVIVPNSSSSIVRVNEDIATSGLVPGMRLQKISGEGRFSTDNAIISQIDYQNNLLFISNSTAETQILPGPFTISNVAGSGSNWTATINSSSLSDNFEVGYMIGATAGSPGTLGDGIVRVTSTNNQTQITIQSNKQIIAGTITNLTTIWRNDHGISGYIEFVGDASTQFDISHYASNIKHNWITQLFCQSIIAAPTKDRNYLNKYTVLSVSENQFLYTGGVGEITSATTSAPFTARISAMSMPWQATSNAAGLRIYANTPTMNITGVTPSSPSSGRVTYTANNALKVGDSVTITGLLPAGYNGTFTTTNVTSSTFSVTNATTTTPTDVLGTASSSGSFGNGEVKVARYISGNSIEIASTAAINNGYIYAIRL